MADEAQAARLLVTEGWDGYALLDSGGGRKLERAGGRVFDRPEPQAMWSRRLPAAQWEAADAVFAGSDGNDEDGGRWRFREAPFETWPMTCRSVRFLGRVTPFRHLGVFPEQAPHWDWMVERLGAWPEPRLLNLFGYTGVASLLAAAEAGARVTHVDASKKAVGWARENATVAGLDGAPIRWIVDDARDFAAREVRRGQRYHGIVLDPPKFGRGPKNEVWNLFDDLPAMLGLTRDLLAPGGFVILTAYAVRASFLALRELCAEVFGPAAVDSSGELVVREPGGGRMVSTSLFCRVVVP
jgi:23S rRNA (cytosine1962-C5)-methyltransferase